MNVDILFYGVPLGEDLYVIGSKLADANDKSYCGKFYSDVGNQPSVKFLVEIREISGRIYSYYNYLVYGNPSAPRGRVVDSAGRSGSYFGFTLKIEGYLCLCIREMYDMFTDIFNSFVVGRILKKDENNNLKWTFSKLADAKIELEEVCNELSSRFSHISDKEFAGISKVDGINGSCKRIHLYSYSNNDILSILKSDDRVVLSPLYKSEEMQLAEERHKQEIEEMSKRIKSSKKESDDKIESLNKEINRLKNYIEKSDSILTQLEQILAKRPKKNSSQPSVKENNSHNTASGNNFIMASSGTDYQQPGDGAHKGNYLLPAGIIAVLLAVVLGSLYTCTNVFSGSSNQDGKDSAPEETSVSRNDSISQFLSIDIENYDSGGLKQDKVYTVCIKGLDKIPAISESEVDIECEGGTIGRDGNKKYTFQVSASEDSCRLYIKYDGEEFSERKFKIDKQ